MPSTATSWREPSRPRRFGPRTAGRRARGRSGAGATGLRPRPPAERRLAPGARPRQRRRLDPRRRAASGGPGTSPRRRSRGASVAAHAAGPPVLTPPAGRRAGRRSPNSAGPTRTIVAPSSTATGVVVAHPHRQLRTQGGAAGPQPLGDVAQAANVPRASSGSATSRPIVMRPRTSRRSAGRQGVQRRRQLPHLEAGLGRIVVHVDLQQDGQARPGPDLRGQAVQAQAKVHRVDRLDDVEQLDRRGAPCSTGAARRGAT